MTGVAVVTGGAGAIGRELVDALAADDYELHVVDRSEVVGEAAWAVGGVPHVLDVTDEDQVTVLSVPAPARRRAGQRRRHLAPLGHGGPDAEGMALADGRQPHLGLRGHPGRAGRGCARHAARRSTSRRPSSSRSPGAGAPLGRQSQPDRDDAWAGSGARTRQGAVNAVAPGLVATDAADETWSAEPCFVPGDPGPADRPPAAGRRRRRPAPRQAAGRCGHRSDLGHGRRHGPALNGQHRQLWRWT